jgi:hypothetical protein
MRRRAVVLLAACLLVAAMAAPAAATETDDSDDTVIMTIRNQPGSDRCVVRVTAVKLEPSGSPYRIYSSLDWWDGLVLEPDARGRATAAAEFFWYDGRQGFLTMRNNGYTPWNPGRLTIRNTCSAPLS